MPLKLTIGIRKELLEGKQGWKITKQVSENIIFRRGGVKKISLYSHLQGEYFTSGGFKQKIPRKVPHINTASREEKEDLEKDKEVHLILS